MRLEEALEARGLTDPRPLYRDLLRQLRQADATAYEQAVRRYEEELGPSADESEADGGAAVGAWIGYGRWLADHLAPGRDVSVDREGRAAELGEDEVPPGALVLHLPDRRNRRALPLALPRDPSAAQSATLELLVG